MSDIEGLHEKAARGFTLAQIELGHSYLIGMDSKGREFTRDYKQAMQWLEAAHNQGASTATFLLGTMHEAGKGVERNVGEAIRLYEIAANAGAYLPCLYLARLYAAEPSSINATEKAITWYRRTLDFEGEVEGDDEMEEARKYLSSQGKM